MSDALVERLAEVLGVALATHCGHCLRPMASEADWENTEEGERPDLCWEDPANCPLGADVEPQQFYARALLPVVEQEIAAARAEALLEAAEDWTTSPDRQRGLGADHWLRDRAARIARTAAQTPAAEPRPREDEGEWEPTRWWRSVAPDGSLWGESSDETEVRSMARPGDTVQRLYERTQQEWRTAAQTPATGPEEGR